MATLPPRHLSQSQHGDDAIGTEPLQLATSLTAFFYERVHGAAHNQGLEATEDALYYLVNLLTVFSSPHAFFDTTADGLALKPLAELYADAVAAESDEECKLALKRLGDLALFISGVFADSLQRKPVDVDYYAAMGGGAYGHLSGLSRTSGTRWRACGEVFEELACNFGLFVDVLDEASENAHFRRDRGTGALRLYEVWLRTGSRRAAERLRRLGLQPHSAASLQSH